MEDVSFADRTLTALAASNQLEQPNPEAAGWANFGALNRGREIRRVPTTPSVVQQRCGNSA